MYFECILMYFYILYNLLSSYATDFPSAATALTALKASLRSGANQTQGNGVSPACSRGFRASGFSVSGFRVSGFGVSGFRVSPACSMGLQRVSPKPETPQKSSRLQGYPKPEACRKCLIFPEKNPTRACLPDSRTGSRSGDQGRSLNWGGGGPLRVLSKKAAVESWVT